jgi:hypothetical protein
VLYPLPEILLLVLAATVVAALAPELFESCFLRCVVHGLRDTCRWAFDLRDDRDIIAVDGKILRRSHDRWKGRNPLHLVPPGRRGNGSCSGGMRPVEKSNEITAISLLLKHLDLDGAPVTMDAMGT